MADTKVKVNGHTNGNGNGNGVEKTPTKHNTKLWQLLALAKEVSKDVGSIEDYEKSAEERKALESELEAKQGENKRLREFNDKIVREFSDHKAQASAKTETLFAEFEQKYKTYESNKAAVEAMEKEVKEAREKLAVAELKEGEVDKLKQRLASSESHAKNHAAEIREMNAECELHKSRMEASVEELTGCKDKLSKAQSDLGEGILRDFGPEEIKKLRSDLQELSKKAHDLVNEYFNDHDGAQDSASEIQELHARFPKIPLSTRTTKAAAKMRCAVADSVIAETLLNHVFVPFYMANDMKATASSMLGFFKGDERRETVYRSQILGSLSDQAEDHKEDIIRKASNEVRSTLHPLVVAYKQTGFYNAVPALFRQAVTLWAEAQRSRDMILAELPDEEDSRGAGQYDDYDIGNTRKAKGLKPTVLAVLFPQFVCRDELIVDAVVLRSDQGAVAEALEEAQQSNGSVNGDTKKKPGTRRRSSAEPKSPLRK
ncbi:rna polymerase [Fusarium austroafricanum]|uniref:Rna polymerase n=1 Tax=Fusarium austroafricanum TaxID=2364996 RepID=A0A8H4KF64_9HYPO|nr:rna polymerase [Fusarium austroafricanum]